MEKYYYSASLSDGFCLTEIFRMMSDDGTRSRILFSGDGLPVMVKVPTRKWLDLGNWLVYTEPKYDNEIQVSRSSVTGRYDLWLNGKTILSVRTWPHFKKQVKKILEVYFIEQNDF